MKKYEILKEDSIVWQGKTLYRIKALRNFSDVKKGDLGGYIQSEGNLSQLGDCWIYTHSLVFENAKIVGNAKVYGSVFNTTRIFGNALIYGYAQVFGNAIYGNAKIYGNARIYENVIVYGDAKVFDNANISGNAKIHGDAKVCKDAWVTGKTDILKGTIIGKINLSYKDIFQYQGENEVLTAILTKDNEILYSFECCIGISKENFLGIMCSNKENPHRKEYLKLIPLIEEYFKEED